MVVVECLFRCVRVDEQLFAGADNALAGNDPLDSDAPFVLFIRIRRVQCDVFHAQTLAEMPGGMFAKSDRPARCYKPRALIRLQIYIPSNFSWGSIRE